VTTAKKIISAALGVVLLQGCAVTPAGPTVQVLPERNKPFEVFAQDQGVCTQYATGQVQGQAKRANVLAAGGAVLGTVLGAGLGAAVGNGTGAAVGAAGGAALGTGIGSGNTSNAGGGIQAQYDNAYVQCMVAKGNQLPPPPTYLMQPTPYIVQPAPYFGY